MSLLTGGCDVWRRVRLALGASAALFAGYWLGALSLSEVTITEPFGAIGGV
jgi:hypothetical protein